MAQNRIGEEEGDEHSDATFFFVATVRTNRLSDEDGVTLGACAALTHRLHGELVRLEGRSVATALAGVHRRAARRPRSSSATGGAAAGSPGTRRAS